MKILNRLNNQTLLLIWPLLSYADNSLAELSDPTRPAFYIQESGSIDTFTENLKLSAIWISKRSRRATINGITARQGDTILSNIRILKIYSNAVSIEQNGSIKKLKLLSRSIKTR